MGDDRMASPDTAKEAAEQLSKLAKDVEDARTRAKRYGTCAAKAETLYRREKPKALIDPSLDGRNQAIRDAKAHEWNLGGDVRQEAASSWAKLEYQQVMEAPDPRRQPA